jgi:putative two-component system response regulator
MGPSRATTALLVEPDAVDRDRLHGYLAADGYRAIDAIDGHAAIRLGRDFAPEVVVVDVRLPDDDACALARRFRDMPSTRASTIIAIADPADLSGLGRILHAGADDFVAKPFGRPELRSRIEAAARSRSLTVEVESGSAVVAALGLAIDLKDPVTAAHSRRVGHLAARVARSLHLDELDVRAILLGALLHDIGKIGIPDGILRNPGSPTELDWAMLRQHPEMGARICGPLALSGRLSPIIRHHHERWDGTGYPDGLIGTQIPLGARLVGVVDAFDAMICDRPYRSARTVGEAVAEIDRAAGTQFDPAMVAAFDYELQKCIPSVVESNLPEPGIPRPASVTRAPSARV